MIRDPIDKEFPCVASQTARSLNWNAKLLKYLMLAHILSQDDYALCLAPGFCRFYAHIGVLDALHEAKCLRASHVSGCSAGAMVVAFLAAGSF
jgi:predicted acylesterase/phospholipase RssA